MKFKVIDRQTNQTVGTYTSEKRAKTKRDKMDNAYGGYRYYVKFELEA